MTKLSFYMDNVEIFLMVHWSVGIANYNSYEDLERYDDLCEMYSW